MRCLSYTENGALCHFIFGHYMNKIPVHTGFCNRGCFGGLMAKLDNLLMLYGYHRGTTASFLERALRRHIQVMAVGPGHAATAHGFSCGSHDHLQHILNQLPRGFQPDAILVVESGVKFFPDGLTQRSLPCWYYSIDPHFNLEWHLEYAKLFDAVWVSFRQYMDDFKDRIRHPSVYGLPHGYDREFYRDHGVPRDIDIAFVGDRHPSLRPERERYLQALEGAGWRTVFTRDIWNEDVAALYSRSRVVFNENAHGVLNPRNFEASACGAVVLANPAVDLETFFTPGEDILIYNDVNELLVQAGDLLQDPHRRQRLSRQAKSVASRHTWDQRVLDFLATANALLTDSPPNDPEGEAWGVCRGNGLVKDLGAGFLGGMGISARCYPLEERIKAHAMVYFKRGLPGKAVELLERLPWRQTADIEVPMMLAMIYRQHGYPVEAAQAFTALLLMEPPPPQSLLPKIAESMIQTFEQAQSYTPNAHSLVPFLTENTHHTGWLEGVRLALTIPDLSPQQVARLRTIMKVVLSAWNLEHIRRRWPEVEERLAAAPHVPDVRIEDNQSISVAGIRLVTCGDRRREAAIQADGIPPDSPVIQLYGVGVGDLPRLLLERPLLEKLQIAILDDALFATLLEHVDCADWIEDPRVSLLLDPQPADIQAPFCVQPACLRLMSDHGPRARLKGQLYLELSTRFVNRDFSDNPVMRQRLAETQPLLGQDGDVSRLFGLSPGRTAVVAGAGPTLARQTDWIRKHRASWLLIATSGSLRPLVAADIQPDVVVVVDPFPILAAQFDIDLSRFATTPLVCFPVVDPEILAAWPGPRLVACSHGNPLYHSWLRQFPRATLHSGGSALHPAVDLAVRMGCRQVILAGADFAFPDGAMRDANSPEMPFGMISGRSMELTDGHGKPVKTAASLRQFLLELEAFIRLHPEVSFISACRDGAQIQGTLFLDQVASRLGICLAPAKPAPLPPAKPLTNSEVVVRLARCQADLQCLRLVEARQHLQELLRSHHAGGNPLLGTRILLALAEVGLEKERLAEVQEPLAEIPQYKPEGWSPFEELTRLRLTAWCHLQENEIVAAGEDLNQALSLLAGLDHPVAASSVHRMVATFYRHLGRLDDAWGHLAQAADKALGDTWEEIRVWRMQSDIHLRRQEYEQARHLLHHALARLEQQGSAPVLRADLRNRLFALELDAWKSRRFGAGQLADCCRALRRGEDAWAYGLLVQWIDTLMKNPKRLADPHIRTLLPTILAAQQQRDSIRLADILEYQLAPLLGELIPPSPGA